MSTTQNSDTENFPVSVIVRAYKDKPVKLAATRRYGSSVEVVGKDTTRGICFPTHYVFRFDDQLYDRLSSAYTDGDTGRLKRLWESAARLGS